MKRNTLIVLIVVLSCLLALLAAGAVILNMGRFPAVEPEATTVESTTVNTAAATTEPSEEPDPSAVTTEETAAATVTTAATEPEEVIYHLSFAGDCTLGTMHEYYYAESGFPEMVGENYDYPLANVQDWFASDDFTMVNLEGPLTNEGTPADKKFVFRGDPRLANVLSEGSVEFVSIANNHSEDFGAVGYENTRKALDAVGVGYAGDEELHLVETERGLKIGVFAVAFYVEPDVLANAVAQLKNQGAEIVVVSFHWGIERDYHHSYDQEQMAHQAVDAGANIVFGHHPHVLQEVEQYQDGIIYYSMGNFSFGGNGDPDDYDTAIISQQVIRDVDGTVRLGEHTVIPCSVSSVSYINNYQPTPAPKDSERYQRVLDKLSGNFVGPDWPDYEQTTEATETATQTTREPTTEITTEAVTEAVTEESAAVTTEGTAEAGSEAATTETAGPTVEETDGQAA